MIYTNVVQAMHFLVEGKEKLRIPYGNEANEVDTIQVSL